MLVCVMIANTSDDRLFKCGGWVWKYIVWIKGSHLVMVATSLVMVEESVTDLPTSDKGSW